MQSNIVIIYVGLQGLAAHWALSFVFEPGEQAFFVEAVPALCLEERVYV